MSYYLTILKMPSPSPRWEMTDDGWGSALAAFRQKVITLSGLVALVGLSALIIGFFVSSTVARIVCGLLVAGAGTYWFAWWRLGREPQSIESAGVSEDRNTHSHEGQMKKLLFDDYQSPAGKYVIREVEEERVHPSSKTIRSVVEQETTQPRSMEIPDFFDLDSDTPYTEVEPKSEFHSLANKVLLVLKEVLFAHTVAFFWANREKRQMVLESMATDSQQFMKERRFPMGGDLISQVAATGKPQLLGRVNPATERDFLRYYEGPAYIKSVLGVPVFFADRSRGIQPVGVIVADSKAEDAFGQETLTLLGRFTKLVSALIKSYTDKYDLLIDSELLASLRRMQDRIKSAPGEQTILDVLAEEAHRLVNWDYLSVTMYLDERRGWAIQKMVNRPGQPYVNPEQSVDLQGGIVGTVIATNRPLTVSDLSIEGRHRFHTQEEIERLGSFLCVPISSINRCYGALALESRKPGQFSGTDVETIFRLVEYAAAMLEVTYMNNIVNDFVMIDQLTGSLTRKYFLKKLEEEVRRASDFDSELSVVTFAVDGMSDLLARYGKDGCDSIVAEAVKVLRESLRPFDAIGRLDDDRLGVLLINTTANDAYVWAEKMRKQVASHVMSLGTRSLSITISAGVCGLNEGMGMNDLLSGTSQVLGKALENGGNLVRVY
jgi:diguanylate cyclase (GGDEF)-like protein